MLYLLKLSHLPILKTIILLLCKNAVFFPLEIPCCMAQINLFDSDSVKQCGEYIHILRVEKNSMLKLVR